MDLIQSIKCFFGAHQFAATPQKIKHYVQDAVNDSEWRLVKMELECQNCKKMVMV